MGRKSTLSATVTYRLLMYTPMGWITVDSIASTTERYSHYPPALRFAVIPMICCAARWCNPSWNLSIYPVTTHISLQYKSIDCTTDLYIAPWSRTVSPVLFSTLATIPHRLQDFRRFCYNHPITVIVGNHPA